MPTAFRWRCTPIKSKSCIEEVVINHCYLGQQLEQTLGDGRRFGISIKYSAEAEMLGTGGGIVKALPLLGDDSFILINSDIWTDYAFKCLPHLDGDSCLAHLVMVDNADHNPAGDFSLKPDGLLMTPPNSQEKTYTYSGVAVFHPDFFAGLSVSNMALLPLFIKAMEAHLVSGEYFKGTWVDVGTPSRLAELSLAIN